MKPSVPKRNGSVRTYGYVNKSPESSGYFSSTESSGVFSLKCCKRQKGSDTDSAYREDWTCSLPSTFRWVGNSSSEKNKSLKSLDTLRQITEKATHEDQLQVLSTALDAFKHLDSVGSQCDRLLKQYDVLLQ